MLVGLGVSGDVERGEVFVESLEDLVEEVTDDLYLRKFAAPDAAPPPISRACALEVAQAAVNDPHAVLAPFGAAEGSEADVRVRLALAVRREVQRRKRLRRLVSYDDQLTRLADSLTDPVSGTAACERLRSRFRVALVDEFQDTDPVQWEILRRAFHGHRTLVLIGDPKQAIYAFRGADVMTYLQAAAAADTTATLSTNWRSDQSLIDALDVVFAGAALGDPRIVYRRVRAAHDGGRLLGGPVSAPLRLRVVGRGQVQCGKCGPAVCASRPATSSPRTSPPTSPGCWRPVHGSSTTTPATTAGTRACCAPADVAVLTRTNSQADLVREALRDGRRARRHHRHVERVRHRRGVGVAGAARSAGTTAAQWPHPVGRAHVLPRLERAPPRHRPARTPWTASASSCVAGRTCSPGRVWPPCSKRCPLRRTCRPGCWPASTGSAG